MSCAMACSPLTAWALPGIAVAIFRIRSLVRWSWARAGTERRLSVSIPVGGRSPRFCVS